MTRQYYSMGIRAVTTAKMTQIKIVARRKQIRAFIRTELPKVSSRAMTRSIRGCSNFITLSRRKLKSRTWSATWVYKRACSEVWQKLNQTYSSTMLRTTRPLIRQTNRAALTHCKRLSKIKLSSLSCSALQPKSGHREFAISSSSLHKLWVIKLHKMVAKIRTPRLLKLEKK